MTSSAPIAILGATSALARDYVLGRSRRSQDQMKLYARRPAAVQDFLESHGLSGHHSAVPLEAFGSASCGGIINFVGVGDPARAKAMGSEIFDATLMSDELAMAHLRLHPEVPYVFLSSGAAYGGGFEAPADESTPATYSVNDIQPQDYYGIAKFYAEARHRGMTGASVVDIRVFNYVSRHMDTGTRFLLADMVAAVRGGTVFRTDATELTRDFIHPDDLGALIDLAVAVPPGINRAVDAYSREPITKAELINLMVKEFGMRCEIVASADSVQATGFKANYYSQNRKAQELGYRPMWSSAEAIAEEVRSLIGRK